MSDRRTHKPSSAKPRRSAAPLPVRSAASRGWSERVPRDMAGGAPKKGSKSSGAPKPPAPSPSAPAGRPRGSRPGRRNRRRSGPPPAAGGSRRSSPGRRRTPGGRNACPRIHPPRRSAPPRPRRRRTRRCPRRPSPVRSASVRTWSSVRQPSWNANPGTPRRVGPNPPAPAANATHTESSPKPTMSAAPSPVRSARMRRCRVLSQPPGLPEVGQDEGRLPKPPVPSPRATHTPSSPKPTRSARRFPVTSATDRGVPASPSRLRRARTPPAQRAGAANPPAPSPRATHTPSSAKPTSCPTVPGQVRDVPKPSTGDPPLVGPEVGKHEAAEVEYMAVRNRGRAQRAP